MTQIPAGPFTYVNGSRQVLATVDPATGRVLFLDTVRNIAGQIPTDYDPNDPDHDLHPFELARDTGALESYVREQIRICYVRGSHYDACPVDATVRAAHHKAWEDSPEYMQLWDAGYEAMSYVRTYVTPYGAPDDAVLHWIKATGYQVIECASVDPRCVAVSRGAVAYHESNPVDWPELT